MIGVNKRKAHVPLWSFRSGKDALQRARTGVSDGACGRNYLSLPDWEFKLFDRPADVPEGFYDATFDVGSWDQVRSLVPPPIAIRQTPLIGSADCMGVNSVADTAETQPARVGSHATDTLDHQLTLPRCCRSPCQATGSARAMAPPCTPTFSTRGPWTRRSCCRTTPPAATGDTSACLMTGKPAHSGAVVETNQRDCSSAWQTASDHLMQLRNRQGHQLPHLAAPRCINSQWQLCGIH